MRHRTTTTVSAALIDIDGVLTVSWNPLPGAVEALERLREMGLPFLLLTNTTSRTRASIAAALAGAGFPVSAESVLTAPGATAAFLAERYPGARCMLLNSGDVREDLTGVALAEDDEAPEGPQGEDVDVVLVGGAGPEFGYRALNRAFGHLQRGARLVAMHRNLYWRTDRGLQLDGGAFLSGLEQASGRRAEVVGKPAATFFTGALARLGVEADRTLMVGDDIESDVLAAQRCGIGGVLVRTGKFQDRALRDADGTPDHVIDSVADLPALVERSDRR
ncbi:HAD-IIA family hydrolase [Kitasatospora sp. NPDC093679]|uniref:HAD-IIA family hydrolase n=1 Tax=Kitasatospora sp. NPDC093679 TaxID=3154983 RepID=UPI003439FCE5